MCWSFEASLGTLIFATACSAYLYVRNIQSDRLYAVYIFVTGLMQGIDAMAWYSIDNMMPMLNKIAAVLSRILISVQIPLIYWSTGESKYSIVVYAFALYLLYVMYVIWTYYDDFKITVDNKCKEGCHLNWSWIFPINNMEYLGIFFVYCALLLYPLCMTKDRRKYMMIGIPLITLVYALYKYGETKMWGSYWCWIINLWSAYAVWK